MKKLLVLILIFVSVVMFPGCGGGNGVDKDSAKGRKLAAGDYFEFEHFGCNVTSSKKTFRFESGSITGRYIDLADIGGYFDSMVWFERDVLDNKDNGARYMMESKRDDYVVCVVPSAELEKGDRWIYFRADNPKNDEWVYVAREKSWTDGLFRKHDAFVIKGVDTDIYYEYCPDLGYFIDYRGDKMVKFTAGKSVAPTKAETKGETVIKIPKR